VTDLTGPALDDWLAAHADELVSVRRHLHSHPEVSRQEHDTTSFVADRLEVCGLEPRVLSVGTGLVCDLGEASGPTVALRADIDALAMEDEKDAPYRSRRPGVAHACGHDVHTTIVLGAGLYLAAVGQHLDGLGGRVRLLFQPAEEQLPGGALDVIADGGMEGVDAVYGLHCDPKLATGTVGFRSGAITSATDSMVIELSGPGGHTARPEVTVDMVSLAAEVVTGLADAVRRRVGGEAPVKLVFGSVHAGDAANVIPAHATLQAAVRTPSPAVWDALPRAVEDAVRELVTDQRARVGLSYTRGVPPVVNDDDALQWARTAVERVLGPAAVVSAPQSWGGDDFAWYLRSAPGAYLRLGTHDPARSDAALDLHAGHFDVDEAAIAVGIRTLVGAVEERLRR
jgi:amidohydrolase